VNYSRLCFRYAIEFYRKTYRTYVGQDVSETSFQVVSFIRFLVMEFWVQKGIRKEKYIIEIWW